MCVAWTEEGLILLVVLPVATKGWPVAARFTASIPSGRWRVEGGSCRVAG